MVNWRMVADDVLEWLGGERKLGRSQWFREGIVAYRLAVALQNSVKTVALEAPICELLGTAKCRGRNPAYDLYAQKTDGDLIVELKWITAMQSPGTQDWLGGLAEDVLRVLVLPNPLERIVGIGGSIKSLDEYVLERKKGQGARKDAPARLNDYLPNPDDESSVREVGADNATWRALHKKWPNDVPEELRYRASCLASIRETEAEGVGLILWHVERL